MAADLDDGSKPMDWAAEVENQFESARDDYDEPKVDIKRIGNQKIVTEIIRDPDSGKVDKITTVYEVQTKRVPRAVAERKKWRKFGEASGDPPGPQTATTVIADETPVQFLTGREDMTGGEPSGGLAVGKDKLQVTCRICGGEHWTTACAHRNASPQEQAMIREKMLGVKAPISEPTPASDSGAPGKYVPPSMRGGMGGSSSAAMAQDSSPSVRVSNLPSDVKDEDLRLLFQQFGKIRKVYLGKDKKTGEFKGFAFVTFNDYSSAESAINKVNGHKYFHMILGVDWANPSKS